MYIALPRITFIFLLICFPRENCDLLFSEFSIYNAENKCILKEKFIISYIKPLRSRDKTQRWQTVSMSSAGRLFDPISPSSKRLAVCFLGRSTKHFYLDTWNVICEQIATAYILPIIRLHTAIPLFSSLSNIPVFRTAMTSRFERLRAREQLLSYYWRSYLLLRTDAAKLRSAKCSIACRSWWLRTSLEVKRVWTERTAM